MATTIMNTTERRVPLWIRSLKVISYSLLFGGGAVVFAGGVYVMFFAPLNAVDPASLNQNTAVLEKIGHFGFVAGVIAVGYAINRAVWRRLAYRGHG